MTDVLKISRVAIAVIALSVSLIVFFTTQVGAQYSSDMIAVHRFYNLKNGTHFFTANESEANSVKNNLSQTYRYENIGFHAYSDPGDGRVSVHRFYNFKNGTHFYTANQSEATYVNNTMWHTYRYEGVAYYSDASVYEGLASVHRFYNFKNGTHFYTANQSEATYVNNTMWHTYRYEGVAYGAEAAVYFKSCADANAAGYYNMLRGQPGYGNHLDRDDDGVACESGSEFSYGGTPMISTFATVTNVVDGDTVDVVTDNGIKERLRLIGIDTLETVDPSKPVQCYGMEASNYARNTLLNQQIVIEPDVTQGNTDAYGRLLRYAILPDSTNFNESMIRQGFAKEYTYDSPYVYQASFREAQVYAKDNLLGLWSPDTCGGNTSQPV